MPQYLISIYQPDGDPPPPDVLGPIMNKLAEWRNQLKAADSWVFSAGLHPPSTATVIRPRGADTVITDGPFTEGKEHLGGFTVVSAPDLDAALRWSSEVAQITGLPVEVRPMQPVDGS